MLLDVGPQIPSDQRLPGGLEVDLTVYDSLIESAARRELGAAGATVCWDSHGAPR